LNEGTGRTGNGTTHLQVKQWLSKNVWRLKAPEFGITRFEADMKVTVKLSL
jgi:hypothetical protein